VFYAGRGFRAKKAASTSATCAGWVIGNEWFAPGSIWSSVWGNQERTRSRISANIGPLSVPPHIQHGLGQQARGAGLEPPALQGSKVGLERDRGVPLRMRTALRNALLEVARQSRPQNSAMKSAIAPAGSPDV
jgi:hypothetical protein